MSMVKLEKDVKIRYCADVVVVGGGVAGAAAAIAAGRQGKSVILIEKSGCLGGLATNGHVSPFDATHSCSGKPFGGIAQEILDEMADAQLKYGVAKNNTMKREGPHLLKWVLLKMAVDAGVRVLFHADLIDVLMDGDKIQYLIIHTKSGIEGVEGKAYVDATGDGDVFAGAGEQYIIGSEADSGKILEQTGLNHIHFDDKSVQRYYDKTTVDRHSVQPVSVMFTLGNIAPDCNPYKYNNKNLTFEDLGIDKEEFKKLPYYGTVGFEDNGDLVPLPQGRFLISSTGRPGEVLVNMSRVIGVDGTDAVELTEASIIAQYQVMYIIDFLKRYIPEFRDAHLVESSNIIGVRETRRLIGQYVLSGLDAINCTQFDDNIGCGSYIIDIHDPFGKCRALGGQIKGDYYGIPYRSLVPKTVKNLLVCGRCISVDHIAHSTTRIQGTCVITGQAAGTAAALSLEFGTSVQDLDVKALQSELKAAGSNIGI